MVEEIHSRELEESRKLNIYLPEGYQEQDTMVYPVIYLLDGSADEDFIYVAGLVQFCNLEWVNLIPKSIVVGIASVNRVKDFTFPTSDDALSNRFPYSGHSDRFLAFIDKELQPLIERNYRASNDRTLIGQSLGDLLTTESLLRKPTLFNRYIIIRPNLWWDNGSLLERTCGYLRDQEPVQPIEIYIGVGKEGLTPTEIPRVIEDDANLLADMINASGKLNLIVHFDYLSEENHATIMHQAVMNAFKLLYSGFPNE